MQLKLNTKNDSGFALAFELLSIILFLLALMTSLSSLSLISLQLKKTTSKEEKERLLGNIEQVSNVCERKLTALNEYLTICRNNNEVVSLSLTQEYDSN